SPCLTPPPPPTTLFPYPTLFRSCLTAWSRALGRRVDRHAALGGQHTPLGPVEAGPHAGQALGRLVAQVSGVFVPGSVYGCMSLRLCGVGHMPIASMPYAFALPCLMNECRHS